MLEHDGAEMVLGPCAGVEEPGEDRGAGKCPSHKDWLSHASWG